MLVCGIDFETQSDDAKTTRVTEVGAILQDFSNPNSVRECYRTLCYDSDYPPQSEFIVELTGITDEMLKSSGIPTTEAFKHLLPMVWKADVIVAHNKAFDKTVFEAEMGRQYMGQFPELKWICTLTEVPYPEKFTCKKLSHLAFEHDIPIDRSKLHRADYDVSLMLDLLWKYDINKVIEYANEPWTYIQAIFDAPWIDGGVGKAKAQKMGFGWEKAKGDDRIFPKWWVKRVKGSKVQIEQEKAAKLNLNIRVM